MLSTSPCRFLLSFSFSYQAISSTDYIHKYISIRQQKSNCNSSCAIHYSSKDRNVS
ncbi:hypothetical protein NC651_037378 [Populus alba x Populus x berolinensis]|nr:hypothetical protein NC651_037378 [Populus alba x Populus x berolinensis]